MVETRYITDNDGMVLDPTPTFECEECHNGYTTEEGAAECEEWDLSNGVGLSAGQD